MLLRGEDPAAMAEEGAVWRLLAPWLRPGQARLWRTAAYRFHALVARPWRVGRAFLLGDAAHQTPPFMGQGLNQGLRDAGNLAWKLALVLRGEAGEALLDSYEAERRPNVRDVIAATKDLGRIVCELDPARAADRDARLRAEVAAGRGDVVRQDLLPPLRDGFLHRPRGAGGAPSPGAGEPCPQPWMLRPGGPPPRRMDDVIGGGFRLLLRAGLALPEAAQAAAAALGARGLARAAAPGGGGRPARRLDGAARRRRGAGAAGPRGVRHRGRGGGGAGPAARGRGGPARGAGTGAWPGPLRVPMTPARGGAAPRGDAPLRRRRPPDRPARRRHPDPLPPRPRRAAGHRGRPGWCAAPGSPPPCPRSGPAPPSRSAMARGRGREVHNPREDLNDAVTPSGAGLPAATEREMAPVARG